MIRTRLLATVALILLVLLVATYVELGQTPAGSVSARYTGFTVNNKSFSLTYLATDQSSRQKGLMNTKVTNGTTMLFVFPKPDYYAFWMFDVNSSLDIIWVNATGGAGRVVYVVENAPSCFNSLACTNYQPTAQANIVIEAKGGFAATNAIAVGTVVHFD